MRGGVGAPRCGTCWKYISSSSEGYGDSECGMLPVKIRKVNLSKTVRFIREELFTFSFVPF